MRKRKESWFIIEQIIAEVECFINTNGRIPRMQSTNRNSEEYRIRERYNNCVTRKTAIAKLKEERSDLYDRVQLIESLKPKLRYTAEEWIGLFEQFFELNKRKPTATKPGTNEYNLARAYDNDFSVNGKRRMQLSPELEDRLLHLERQKEWKLRATVDETIKELETFCVENNWFPLRNSPDNYERSLAARVAQFDRFTDEQKAVINILRKRYRRNDRVSFPEKVFFQIISKILGESVVANRRICNYEADVSFPYKGSYYIVQYDGKAFHATEESILNDIKATEAHLSGKNRVIRLRETGLPSLNSKKHFPDHMYLEMQVDPNNFTQESVSQVVSKIFVRIGYDGIIDLSYRWDEIVRTARYESSTRKTAIKAICEYFEYILYSGETPSRSCYQREAKGVHLDMRIKALLDRNCFDLIDLEALAMLEMFYEPNRRKRNQKAFAQTGKIVDFEKGSQFTK